MIDTCCPDCGKPQELPEDRAWSLRRIDRLCDACMRAFCEKEMNSDE